MIKLMNWPKKTIQDPDNPEQLKEVDGDPVEIYVNPKHIIVLDAQDGGTVVALLGYPPIRVKEDIPTVQRRMKHPGDWMQ